MEFNAQEILNAFVGGALIGLSVTLMLLFKGRVTGISGITYGLLNWFDENWIWRAFFLIGLVSGGALLATIYPMSLENTLKLSNGQLVLAGLFVGYGTVLGNGCTSGHGVCGISRFSLRSITATLIFICFGVLTVALLGALK